MYFAVYGSVKRDAGGGKIPAASHTSVTGINKKQKNKRKTKERNKTSENRSVFAAKKYPERKIYRTAACTAFGDNKTRKCGKSEYMKCSLVRCCRKSVRKPEAFRTLFCTFFGEVNILGTEDTECVPVTDYRYV